MDGAGVVAIRPEHLRFVDVASAGLDARVELVLPLGPLVVYDVVLTDGTRLSAGRDADAKLREIMGAGGAGKAGGAG